MGWTAMGPWPAVAGTFLASIPARLCLRGRLTVWLQNPLRVEEYTFLSRRLLYVRASSAWVSGCDADLYAKCQL
jgi:hypothetical protein